MLQMADLAMLKLKSVKNVILRGFHTKLNTRHFLNQEDGIGRGIIGAESIASMSPEEAPKYLEGLAWYFEGGSYFDSNGKLSKGHLFLDI